jgi:predicted RNA-binding protein with PIN domain
LPLKKSRLDTDILSEIGKAVDPIVSRNATAYGAAFGRYTLSTITVISPWPAVVAGRNLRSSDNRLPPGPGFPKFPGDWTRVTATGDRALRYLIDGYNLMHAKGLMQHKFRGDGLHRARLKFLDAVLGQLGPLDTARTTVVFDAALPPRNRPAREEYKGLTVLYAVGEENADAVIERLIEQHSAPKQLAVVSSDRRVREAARRRGSRSVEADAFWVGSHRRSSEETPHVRKRASDSSDTDRPTRVDPAEARRLAAEFAEADRDLAHSDFPGNRSPLHPSDEEIRQIEGEVENEEWSP